MRHLKFIKKADIALFIFLLFLGFALLWLVNDADSTGENVVISINGEIFGTYPLDKDKILDIKTQYGNNQVIIKNGCVRVSQSDCPNHECEAFGNISSPRQTIICLPHRLIITITGQSDIDVVVY